MQIPVLARLMRPALPTALLLAALPLAGCMGHSGRVTQTLPPMPSFYDRLEGGTVKVDAPMAASMISGYRANNGQGPLQVNPALNAIAQRQADAMAARDEVGHSIGGSFQRRLAAGGYDAEIAVENIGAGYRTLAEAFSGWRDSPSHRANMLKAGVSEMGIATAYAPGSKYKVFWALVLAKPDEKRPLPQGPVAAAGPR